MNEDIKKTVQKALAHKGHVIGAARCLKALRQGTLGLVLLSKDCPESGAIMRQCSLHQASCEQLDVDSAMLGTLCKKPFAISAVGVPKA